MQAIVTALDEPWRERVEEIWAELKAVFQLKSVEGSTEPHFAFHAAEQYDAGPVGAALTSITSIAPPFEVETHGLGVFRGDQTVLFLHVTPSDALRALHAAVFEAVQPLAAAPTPVYAAATWVPHIALAVGDLREEQLPEITSLLGRRDYRWRVRASNLCLISDTESRTAARTRWELSG
jgi:2'-5' RNA ligase